MKSVRFFTDDGISHGDSVQALKTYIESFRKESTMSRILHFPFRYEFEDSTFHVSRPEDTDYTISSGLLNPKTPDTVLASSGVISGTSWESDTNSFWNEQWIEYKFDEPICIFKVSILTHGSGPEHEVNGFEVLYKREPEDEFQVLPSVKSPIPNPFVQNQVSLYTEAGVWVKVVRIVPTSKLSYVGLDGSFSVKLANVVCYGFSEEETIRILSQVTS